MEVPRTTTFLEAFRKCKAKITITMQKSTYDRIMLLRQTGTLWNEAERYEETNSNRWFKLLRNLVRQGHNDAGLMARLAVAYADGEGVKPNRLQALRWNKKAWRRGYAVAACNAGIDARHEGRQVLAITWFRRAIAMEDSDALLHLAKLFLQFDDRRREALGLLRQRVDKGPQMIVDIVPGEDAQRVADDDWAEAKRLAAELEASIS